VTGPAEACGPATALDVPGGAAKRPPMDASRRGTILGHRGVVATVLLLVGACGGSSATGGANHTGSGDAPGPDADKPADVALSPAAQKAVAAGALPGDAERFAVPAGDGATRGAAAPLVVVVQFSDFECPFCQRVVPTLEALLEKYPSEVRLVFRHNPLPFHRRARPAAIAAEEVRRQAGDGGFWRFHDLLFANQRDLGDDDLLRLAAQVPGVDGDEVARALAEDRHGGRIAADQKAAQRFGAVGTPYHFINGRPLAGAQPFGEFDAMVREEIAVAARFIAMGMPRDRVVSNLLDGAETSREPPEVGRGGPRHEPDPEAIYAIPITGDEPVQGPGDALVTIVEFSDFQCPFCARVQSTLERLRDEHGGDLRLVWKNNPLPFHDRALPAAIAAHAVFRQVGPEGFWRFHDLVFAHQEGGMSQEDILGWAAEVPGVDVDAVRAAVEQEAHREVIQRQQDLAAARGARGTPTFFINGRMVRGAQPYEVFAEVVDEELARARRLVAEGTPRAGVYEAATAGGATTPQMVESE